MHESVMPTRWSEVTAAPAAAPDLISLRDHVMDVEIGAFQQERGTVQSVRFTLVAALERRPGAALADDVDTILSYDLLRDAIEDELATGRINLLETLAERIAARVLREPQVQRISVRIEKLDRCSGELGVEILRHQGDVASDFVVAPVSRGRRIVVLPSGAVRDPGLSELLDALTETGGAILVLAPQWPAPDPDVTDVPPVQRRIDLLTLDQAAWRLAACDARCVVVASRTELDWGLRQGQISIWAPAKLAADARGLPRALREGGVPMLARWLAAQLDLSLVTASEPGTLPSRADLVPPSGDGRA